MSQSAEKEVPVELGFVEERESWKLSSAFFVSKLGGKPSWLELKNLPKPNDIKCKSCDGPTKFLLQIYAPQDSDDSFHRTIFIFVCTSKRCCVERNSNKNFIVVRSQLKRENEFYSSEPIKTSKKYIDIAPEKFGVKLCRVCGVFGSQSCGNCKRVNYCTKDHQAIDWKAGHKDECNDADFKLETSTNKNTFNFKEFEIVIDTEVIPKEQTKGKSDKERLEEFKKLASEGKAGTLDETASEKDLMEAASFKSDKVFNKFTKRCAYHHDQILRYDRCGTPLWVADENQLETSSIPPCESCKGPRVFEFQLMPQMLNYLGSESCEDLDWGTVAIYTCSQNCPIDSYVHEFAWKQDFKPDSKE